MFIGLKYGRSICDLYFVGMPGLPTRCPQKGSTVCSLGVFPTYPRCSLRILIPIQRAPSTNCRKKPL